jgi:hypothetical protein
VRDSDEVAQLDDAMPCAVERGTKA